MFKNVYYDDYKGKMHIWETGPNGKTIYSVIDHDIEYYIEDKTKKSPIKDIFGTSVIKQVSNSKRSVSDLKKSGIRLFESDLKEEVKFLHKRYGDTKDDIDYKSYKVANIDIEIQSGKEFPKPEEAKYPINLITVDCYKTDEITSFGLEEYTGEFLNRQGYTYIHCESEEVLLEKFCEFIRKSKIDIITGWNIGGFDIPYICNRINNLSLNCSMSPLGRTIKKRNGEFVIPGISCLDEMELYKKFSYQNQASYSLNWIGLQEVGEGKLDYEGQINDLWARDWNLFVDYNIQDCFLVRKIENKRKFIDLVINLCVQTRTPFENVFSTIAIVEGYMLRYLHRDNIVFNDRQFEGDEEEHIEGGYVEAHPGFYNFLLSIDATSLYPSNIRMFNISPETKVINPESSVGLIKTQIPGVFYKKEQGYLPKIVTDIFRERKHFQQLMRTAGDDGDKTLEEYYDSQQLIRKILINSMYGVLCNRFFHFFDLDNASVVTAAGRDAIKYIAQCNDQYFHEVFPKIYKKYYPNATMRNIKEKRVMVIDTDSNYIWFEDLYKCTRTEGQSFLDWALEFEKMIFEPFLEKCMNIYASKFDTENLIFFKREKIILKQYVQAKKKYATLIVANEKKIYKTPELKITGIEINKSDLCTYSRKKIKRLVDIMFEGELPSKENMLAYIRVCHGEFKKQPIQEISTPKGVKDYDKYSVDISEDLTCFKPSTPIHNRASIVYNHIIKSNQLPYMEISNGTKMKYIFVQKNKYKSNIIGYVGNYPKEFEKIFKIDFEEQFDKQFKGIAQRMFDTLDFGDITMKDTKIAFEE